MRSACRRWSSPPPSPSSDQLRIGGERRLARAGPDQAGGSRLLARLVDLLRLQARQAGDNSNTQYALLGLHAASEAGVPVKPEVWTLARDYWARYQKQDGSWAYTPDSPTSSRQHDLRGHLQPDHQRAEAVSGAGDSSRARPSRTAARGRATATSSAGSTGSPATSRSARTSATGQQLEVLLPVWTRARRPSRGHPLLRRQRLVSPGRRGAGPRSRTSSAGSGRARCSSGSDRLDELRPAVPGQGAGAGADQQAAAWPRSTTGTTTPTTSATSSTKVSRRLEEPADVAGRRPRHRDGRGPAPGPDRFLQRPPGPRVLRGGAGEPPRVRRAGRVPLRRGLLRRATSSTGVSAS